MEEAKDKFLKYLKEIEKICNHNIRLAKEENVQFMIDGQDIEVEVLERDRLKVEQLLYFLNSDKKTLYDNGQVFVNYPYMSDLLESSPLNAREKMIIVFHIAEKNLEVFASENYCCSIIFDADIFKSLYAPNKSYEEFRDFFKKLNISKLLTVKKEKLTEEEQNLKEKILESVRLSQKRSQLIITCHSLLNKHYFKKINSYTEQDIKFVSVALSKLSVWENLVGSTIRLLTKDLEKRKQEESPKLKQVKSDYDYNSLCKEVENYIDLNTMDPKRVLTKEEEIHVLTILTRMHVDREQRRAFLRKSEMLVGSKHPITKYIENYDKLKYYEAKVGIQNELQDMEEYFANMFVADDETYLCCREYLEETLKKVNFILPKNFLYEETEANARLSK